eukprot:jgi/Ulvmu1/1521/UM011_0251.1
MPMGEVALILFCAQMAGLHGNTCLHTLSLRHNHLAATAAKAIGEMLMQNIGLRILALSWNALGPTAGELLSRGIPENKSLQLLDLSWNGLETKGAVAVVNALASNKGLTMLSLSSTRLSDGACPHIVAALSQNSVIEQLMLNGNSITESGTQTLVQALQINRTLKHLGLMGMAKSVETIGMECLSQRIEAERPEGTYALQLEKPSEREIALQLISLDRGRGGGLMRDVRQNGLMLPSGPPEGWPASMPATGILEFNFVKSRSSDSHAVLDSKKLTALIEELQKPYMSDSAKVSRIMMLAPYTMLYSSQIVQLLQGLTTGDALVHSACVLFTRCVDLETGADEICGTLPQRDSHFFCQQLGHVTNFRGANPTGHYELSLHIQHQRMLAIRLKDQAEKEGSAVTWKNVLYERTTQSIRFPSRAGPPEDWAGSIPIHGHLTLDYISSVQAPPSATAVTPSELNAVLASCDLSQSSLLTQTHTGADVWPDRVRKWRAAVCKIWLTCMQIVSVMACFGAGPDRVEVAVSSWARCIDKSNTWQLLYHMSGMEQNVFMVRLGPGSVWKLLGKHISCHWFLDYAITEHEEVAGHLVREAQAEDSQNWFNLKLSGRSKTFPENAAMLGFLTTESKTPIVHVNTLFQDSWVGICKLSGAALDGMTNQERLEIRNRTAQRLNLEFMLEFSPYFDCAAETRTGVPGWKSAKALLEPMATAVPWVAVWNRTVRKMVRLKMKDLAEGAESPLHEWFLAMTHNSPWMDTAAFEAWLNQSGYPTAICSWLSKQMSKIAREENSHVKGHASDINFSQFSGLLRQNIPEVRKSEGLQKDLLVHKFINKLKAARRETLQNEAGSEPGGSPLPAPSQT